MKLVIALLTATLGLAQPGLAQLGLAQLGLAQPPVILISVDTLRADRFHPDGGWLEGGTLFTNAASQIPLTLPSHTVLFTSTYPWENRVEENAATAPQGLTTLASVLRARGYKTAAFIGSIFLERELGLDQGFETYDSPFSFGAFSKLSGEMLAGHGGTARERRPGALVLRAANQWMAAHQGEPVFVFIHLFDVHKPWPLGSYDAQASAMGQLLGGFRQTLQKQGWWEKALVVVTADHGEGLGDHGESDHGYFLYDSTLHVPLLFHWPQGKGGERTARLPARVENPVGLVDVAPSILDFLHIPAPAAFHGHTVLDGSARPVLAESVYARDSFGWAALRSVRSGNWKYIDAPIPELYDLAKDPRELTNLVGANATQAASLRDRLPRLTAGSGAVGDTQVDPKRKAALESLGYLAPGPRGAGKPANAADPKTQLPILLRYEDALAMMAARRYNAAITIFRTILTKDPGNLLVRRDLGVALIEKKQFTQALAELRQVAAAAPDDYITRYELGLAQESAGHLPEAADQFAAALKLAPGSIQAKEALARVRR